MIKVKLIVEEANLLLEALYCFVNDHNLTSKEYHTVKALHQRIATLSLIEEQRGISNARHPKQRR